MSETDPTGASRPRDPRPTLSRRRVLQLGLAAVPAVCGARLVSGAIASFDDAVRGALSRGVALWI